MKLIDLLVQELPKRGGWPDGAITADAFPYEKGLINFFDKKGEFANDKEPLKLNSNYKPAKIETVTREQYEAALALAQQSVWSGEGLPPVGGEFEYMEQGCSRWIPVEIVFSSKWVIVLRSTAENEGKGVDCAFDLVTGRAPTLRPIRSEADKKRAEIIEEIAYHTSLDDARDLYEAIAAGQVKGVKLDV